MTSQLKHCFSHCQFISSCSISSTPACTGSCILRQSTALCTSITTFKRHQGMITKHKFDVLHCSDHSHRASNRVVVPTLMRSTFTLLNSFWENITICSRCTSAVVSSTFRFTLFRPFYFLESEVSLLVGTTPASILNLLPLAS